MAGFGHAHHAPAADDPRQAARNARYGLWLFGLYCVIYAAFVGLNAFSPDVMSTTIAGVNLAVAYGMGLIAAALVLALVYCGLCHGPVAGEARAAGRDEGGRA
jgi:uncharacterized membrane protein (DUF485 family)